MRYSIVLILTTVFLAPGLQAMETKRSVAQSMSLDGPSQVESKRTASQLTYEDFDLEDQEVLPDDMAEQQAITDSIAPTESTRIFITNKIDTLNILHPPLVRLVASYFSVSPKATAALIAVLNKENDPEQENEQMKDIDKMRKLAVGADLNMPDKSGYTAFQWALGKYASYELIKLFVRSGADAMLKDPEGDTAARFLQWKVAQISENLGELQFMVRNRPILIAPYGWARLIWYAGIPKMKKLFNGEISEAELEQEDLQLEQQKKVAAQQERSVAELPVIALKQISLEVQQAPAAPQATVLKEKDKQSSCCSIM